MTKTTLSPQDLGSEPPTSGDAPIQPVGFDQELCELVADFAPRLFAVVQVYGAGESDMDGRIAAWGMAYSDGHAQVISADGTLRMSLGSPERATRLFARRAGVTARLVCLAPPGNAALDRADAA